MRTISTVVSFTVIPLLSLCGNVMAEKATIWIGSMTPAGGESKGIYRATLDLETGVLSKPALAAEIASPGFVAIHPNGNRLYSVCQLPNRQS